MSAFSYLSHADFLKRRYLINFCWESKQRNSKRWILPDQSLSSVVYSREKCQQMHIEICNWSWIGPNPLVELACVFIRQTALEPETIKKYLIFDCNGTVTICYNIITVLLQCSLKLFYSLWQYREEPVKPDHLCVISPEEMFTFFFPGGDVHNVGIINKNYRLHLLSAVFLCLCAH